MKHVFLSLFSLFILHSPLFAQFEIGTTEQIYIDSDRNNREVLTIIHYPAETTGNDASPAGSNHPMIVIGHGFAMTPNAYTNFAEVLVPLGYVVVLPGTETSIIPAPSHIEFARDIRFLANYMREQSENNSNYLLYNRLSDKVAISGHSMGGGAALLAAAINENDFDTYIGFASAETGPSAINAAGELISLPVLMFSGENDGVTPPANHQDPMYNALSVDCKLQIYINGGGHCYFANTNIACDLGESFSPPGPSISRQKQQEITFRYLIPWLDYHLKGIEVLTDMFESLENDDEVSFRKTCVLSTGSIPWHPKPLEIFPNPVEDRIHLNLEGLFTGQYKIHDALGRLVSSATLDTGNYLQTINTQALQPGLYWLSLYCNKAAQKYSTTFVKR